MFAPYARTLDAVVWVSAGLNEPPLVLLVLLALRVAQHVRPERPAGLWAVVALYVAALVVKQPAIILPALLLLGGGRGLSRDDRPGWRELVRRHMRQWWPLWAIAAAYGLGESVPLVHAGGQGATGYGLVHIKEFLHYLVEYPTLAVVPFLQHSWTIRAQVVALYGDWLRRRDARALGVCWFVVATSTLICRSSACASASHRTWRRTCMVRRQVAASWAPLRWSPWSPYGWVPLPASTHDPAVRPCRSTHARPSDGGKEGTFARSTRRTGSYQVALLTPWVVHTRASPWPGPPLRLWAPRERPHERCRGLAGARGTTGESGTGRLPVGPSLHNASYRK